MADAPKLGCIGSIMVGGFVGTPLAALGIPDETAYGAGIVAAVIGLPLVYAIASGRRRARDARTTPQLQQHSAEQARGARTVQSDPTVTIAPDGPTAPRWSPTSSVCANCAAHPRLAELRDGRVALASILEAEDTRCAMCGLPFEPAPPTDEQGDQT